jgi:hypothetical protein
LFGATPKADRYIRFRQNSTQDDIKFFTEEADIYIKSGSSEDAWLSYDIDFTLLNVLSLETKMDYDGSGSARIAIGSSTATIFTTTATHDWTRRSFDVTSRTGTQKLWFYNDNGGEFSLRNIRLY